MTPLAGHVVAPELSDFTAEVLAGTGVSQRDFWTGLSGILAALTPRIRALLSERSRLQGELDAWHARHPGPVDGARYVHFLRDIGYLVDDARDASVTTENASPELHAQAGPQLVVPVTNARYAINAVNARWVSLYDALYGTDALLPLSDRSDRSAAVVRTVRELLDRHAPLEAGSHLDTTAYTVSEGRLVAHLGHRRTTLRTPESFVGYRGAPTRPTLLVLQRHGLRLILDIDPLTAVGGADRAGVSDVRIEAAPSTIVDLEDSVAVVDAEDKVLAYRNWWGLCRGDLTSTFRKGDAVVERRLAPTLALTSPEGAPQELPGRSHMLVRSVGLHMMTDMVQDPQGRSVPEAVLDVAMTALCATIACRAGRISPTLAVVVPKLHGPEEVALATELLGRVEALLGLRERTLLLGLMDEERRTSANLGACIAAAADRVVFINTGFLDRSGDEIRSTMNAGPVPGREHLRHEPWMTAYEARNVRIGLESGLAGRGQIGKGMWAQPDEMKRMRAEKITHPRAGASTAWVPSPTAAALHALHYWEVDVAARQAEILAAGPDPAQAAGELASLLTPPIVDTACLTDGRVREELDDNVHAILGYVSRWVDQGIGCSTVPDLRGVGRMEDRATLRISSQLIANWLHHGIVTAQQVEDALLRMAHVVDEQSCDDPTHVALLPDRPEAHALHAARALALDGGAQPGGYTEAVLHRFRRLAKRSERQKAAV